VVIADMQVDKGEAIAAKSAARFVKCDVSQEARWPGRRRQGNGRLGKLMGWSIAPALHPPKRPPARMARMPWLFSANASGQPDWQLQHDPPVR
jgi:hypothetical protein